MHANSDLGVSYGPPSIGNRVPLRDVVKAEQEVPNEFHLVFDDGEVAASPTTSSDGLVKDGETRRPGAYYKLIERKTLLKKKRTEVQFPPTARPRTGSFLCSRCGAGSFLFSRSNTSATSGLLYGTLMYPQVRKKQKSDPACNTQYCHPS